jgi:hypothetical protein
VPHDLRRKGAPLANQLTVLFYRLQHTNSLEEAANLLLTQSQQMIERGVHKHFQSFLKAVTLLPHALLVRVLKIPTAGQFASFYFSDTGDSLSTLLEATGGVDGVHYPPHFSPPEFTVVFSRVRERQTVMVVAGMKHGTEGALDRFERELRRELLEE